MEEMALLSMVIEIQFVYEEFVERTISCSRKEEKKSSSQFHSFLPVLTKLTNLT